MTLNQAHEKFGKVIESDIEYKEHQEAFNFCMEFLFGVEKIKNVSSRITTYGCKHYVEYPSSKCCDPKPPSIWVCYVPEEIFVLAALASGFTYDARERSINISFSSLNRRVHDFAFRKSQEVLGNKAIEDHFNCRYFYDKHGNAFPAFYCGNQRYYVRNERGDWSPISYSKLKARLLKLGYPATTSTSGGYCTALDKLDAISLLFDTDKPDKNYMMSDDCETST